MLFLHISLLVNLSYESVTTVLLVFVSTLWRSKSTYKERTA